MRAEVCAAPRADRAAGRRAGVLLDERAPSTREASAWTAMISTPTELGAPPSWRPAGPCFLVPAPRPTWGGVPNAAGSALKAGAFAGHRQLR